MPNNNDSRQDILLFQLRGTQLFGINVLKIQEIIHLTDINKLPESHPAIIGVAKLRGRTLPVIDLSLAIGGRAIETDAAAPPSIIVTEFNRVMQGFLVRKVEHILPIEWNAILPPPRATGRSHYITGVVQHQQRIVEIVDVEKVLSEVSPPKDASQGVAPLLAQEHLDALQNKRILVVDDSNIARKQVAHTLQSLGIDFVMAEDGRQALDTLEQKQREGIHFDMIVSDIEMPEMDGYTLTQQVRRLPELAPVYILLHTSLSGTISRDNAMKSGADAALTKFAADDLARAVIQGLTGAQ